MDQEHTDQPNPTPQQPNEQPAQAGQTRLRRWKYLRPFPFPISHMPCTTPLRLQRLGLEGILGHCPGSIDPGERRAADCRVRHGRCHGRGGGITSKEDGLTEHVLFEGPGTRKSPFLRWKASLTAAGRLVPAAD